MARAQCSAGCRASEWRRFANLRALYGYMYAHPGKKLLFMGSEFGQYREWAFAGQPGLEPAGLSDAPQAANLCARSQSSVHPPRAALHEVDFSWEGFQWIDLHDVDQSALSFLRRAKAEDTTTAESVIVAANFTPVPREGYRVGVPQPGFYRELLNSDSDAYGGSNMGNKGGLPADAIPWQEQPHSILITLPPLAVVYFKLDGNSSSQTRLP